MLRIDTSSSFAHMALFVLETNLSFGTLAKVFPTPLLIRVKQPPYFSGFIAVQRYNAICFVGTFQSASNASHT
jgi:hypothetical protein